MAGVGITQTFVEPFYSSTEGASADVPGRYHVSVAGHPYMVDLESDEFRHESIPLLRTQADDSATVSENSVSREGLWRRSQDSWHKGQGQTALDRDDSLPARYNASKGVDIWDKWQISLLNDTESKRASGATDIYLTPAGSRLYLADGSTGMVYTTDISGTSPTWTSVTGEPATVATAIASNGYEVFSAHGADGVYMTTNDTTVTSSYNTTNVDLVAWTKGRLMASSDNVIYNITGTTTSTTLLTHDNTDFNWVGFAEGTGHIYAAGYSGDKSLIYRITLTDTDTALGAPTVAGRLPDGEIVRSIYGYLGYILIGTDSGVRFADVDTDGNLIIGALADTSATVRCFEGQGAHVWFGWDNYDTTSTGLGRLSLEDFAIADRLAPAFASDLMATAQGQVRSVVTFGDLRVFSVDGAGVFAENTSLVSSGTLETGTISYRLSAPKTASRIEVIEQNSAASSYQVEHKHDTGSYVSAGTITGTGSFVDVFSIEVTGAQFELRFTLNRDSADQTLGPTLSSWTLLAFPSVQTEDLMHVPVLLYEEMTDLNGNTFGLSPTAELAFIKTLKDSRSLITYKEGVTAYSSLLEDYEWRPHHMTRDKQAFNGTCLLHLKDI